MNKPPQNRILCHYTLAYSEILREHIKFTPKMPSHVYVLFKKNSLVPLNNGSKNKIWWKYERPSSFLFVLEAQIHQADCRFIEQRTTSHLLQFVNKTGIVRV